MLELHYSGNERIQEHKRSKDYPQSEDPNPDLRFDGKDEIDGFTYTLVIEDDFLYGDPGDHDMGLGTLTEYPAKDSSWKIDPDIANSHYRNKFGMGFGFGYDPPDLYWNPMEEIETHEQYIRRAGASKQVARELATAQEKAMRDRRLSYGEGWSYVLVGVQVSKNGIELGSDYIGGVESDFFDNGYGDELIPELAANALIEAKQTLETLTA